MTTTIAGIDDLKALIGQHLGYSERHEVTQQQVNLFADATGGPPVDPRRCRAGPGRAVWAPIAHGYLTLSLADSSSSSRLSRSAA